MKNIQYKILVLIVIVNLTVTAQTSNTGLITINPGTQFSVVDDFTNSNEGSFINDGDALFYNNFTNNGMVDYMASGLTSFLGATQQIIAGNNPSYFYDVFFNNTSGLENAITLSGIINTENEVDFTQGIVNTIENNGEFILQNGTTTINTSNYSFVDGFITKEGNSSFIFPVGDSEFYRYASITAPTDTNSTIKGRYVFQDPEDTYRSDFKIGNIELLNNDEYWILENNNLGVEQVYVTLPWDETTTTPLDVVAAPEIAIRLVRWDFEQGAWTEVASTIDTVNKTVTSEELQNIEGAAVYTIARADLDIILPDGVIVWNGVSPNNDGKNDFLLIEKVDELPNNSLKIYNRWGALVFETTDYGSNNNYFDGHATGESRLLPTGTYFYVLAYDSTNSGRVEKAGFLHLNTD